MHITLRSACLMCECDVIHVLAQTQCCIIVVFIIILCAVLFPTLKAKGSI